MASDELEDSQERLVLSDLLNRVLDKGVVIGGDVTISVADIDLVRLGLRLLLSSVETAERRVARTEPLVEGDADSSLLPPSGQR